MDVPFVQFLLPNGKPREVVIDRPLEIGLLAEAAIKQGVRFEAEILTTGETSFEAMLDDECLAIEVCENGPPVLAAVDKLIRRACERMCDDIPRDS